MCDYNENIDTPEKITRAEFMSIVAKSCSESKVDFPISEEIYERNSKWLNLQPWKRSTKEVIMVNVKELNEMIELCNRFNQRDLSKEFNKLRSRALGKSFCDFTYECLNTIELYANKGCHEVLIEKLKSYISNCKSVVDYKKLVNECNTKSNNAKKLAQTLYDKWLNLGRGEEHLIGIYKAMSVITLSTYELERLTKKRLVMDVNGYSLIDCSYDDTVTMESLKSIDTECRVENANALGVLNTYKSKYSISDSMWPVELERLQTLCSTTDIYTIADFIETNFL